ncbi:MAG: tRNA (guanine-N(1)-)-methyltransferase [candidate division WS6 bacterium OLB20]|uniref:tRNA (guanine-N(1)-)-methyltransferase n=1 Tax=candidate division WS6 bacterium OLB20 TaxID=1617426 RepID=A0A136LZ50_9BACT|nr:MAG: tRNA (guanine-N(1)-)-methyltransferase [candidate division WS6 bacterium OLB20]
MVTDKVWLLLQMATGAATMRAAHQYVQGMLQIHFLTIFPGMFPAVLEDSILGRAAKAGRVSFEVHNLRSWTDDNHQTVDDRPFGGGPGMVMMVEPLYKAIRDIKERSGGDLTVLVTGAKGTQFSQSYARELSEHSAILIICGHYEGIDQRIIDNMADAEVSIGPYVLTGGELPALVIADAVTRLLPGVLGNEDSLANESHDEEGVLEAPHYTRPAEFTTAEGDVWKVPDVLLSGDHKNIARWREQQSKTSAS